ncbi:MAG TPA: SPOR domain-containing protein [Woeseiaceae bacterium]|nr:SPOR domain-containing protein [Woeseiaceae bacterium]
MAQQRKKRRSSRQTARATSQAEYPGWAWGAFGLAIGLSVAAAVWVSERRSTPLPASHTQAPASLENALGSNDETSAKAGSDPAPAGTPAKSRFDFYEMLPNFEVIVPEVDTNVARDVEPKAVVQPGTYVLQAGSFTTYADADRRRAELALQGIESNIQKITIDAKTYHRVRIGPTDDLDRLNLLRSRLRAAKIDALRIRLGD